MTGMQQAVCLVSGGLDSCVAVACAVNDGFEPALLHMQYGQRTENQELRAFQRIAKHYGARERLVCELPHFREIGGSALTDARLSLDEGDSERGDVPVSYVPFRNAVLLAVAASWAEVVGARRLYVGVVHEDSLGYPDCSPAFVDAMNRAVQTGTRPDSRITIRAPLIELNKAEIVRLGMQLGAPLESTWSCYRDGAEPCGGCDSCRLRQRGFEEARVRDPASRSPEGSRT